MSLYKNLLNELARNENSVLHQLTEDESRLVKQKLMEMYKDFASLCDANGLAFMLDGGNCLGAVRHQGFIPWDDDLDVMMPRQDYERLKELVQSGALGDKYEYTCPNDDKDAPCCFMKLYLKGTRWVEIGNENSKYPKGLFLDIFIIDGAPKNKICRKIKGFIANSLRLIANMVMESCQGFSESQRCFYSASVKAKLFIKCRRFLGKIFSIIPHKKWICWFDNFVKCNVKENCISTIPTNFYLYGPAARPTTVFLPVSYGMFEGVKVPLPNDPNAYLKQNYGPNYMTPPPENKRERHFIVEMKL